MRSRVVATEVSPTLMPKGVEHFREMGYYWVKDNVSPTLMPKGVEHWDGLAKVDPYLHVSPTLMPKGVEHPKAGVYLGGEERCRRR